MAEQLAGSPSAGRAPARNRSNEPEPVLSGRLWIAFLLLFGIGFLPASPLVNIVKPPELPRALVGEPRVGNTVTVAVSVITSDYAALACADPREFEGVRCEYVDDKGTPAPHPPGAPLDDNRARIVQPYRTWPQNDLVFLAGLWADPEVALRLHREPAAGVATKQLARFVARCKAKVVGQLEPNEKMSVRWSPEQRWLQEGPAWIGVVESCTIDREKR